MNPTRTDNGQVPTTLEAQRRADASPFVDLVRSEWSALHERTPLPLTADEVERVRGLGDVIDLQEVQDVYLPLSRLLQAMLARWPEHPRVELVTTDGFLLPNAELRSRGLMARKGFPESYDRRALTRFVADVKSGKAEVTAPVYSHLVYDIVEGERLTVHRPDILIVEGLNVLQPALPGLDGRTRVAVADFFDFSIYVDARVDDVERWYLDRFRKLRETAFQDPTSYFRRYAEVPEDEAIDYARQLWRTINRPNLVENVAPTRGRASLILRKGADHKVQRVRLRKL